MNVNFKVLWFEDEMGWRPSSERSMKKIIESHNLVPIITWKKGDEGDAEEELKKEYDLILMDYELRGTMGNILIKKERWLWHLWLCYGTSSSSCRYRKSG